VPELLLAQATSVFTVDMLVVLGLIAVVLVLFLTEVVPILVSALGREGGGMVATGCVRPNEVYEAVDWSVIVLLAGLIPLGMAMAVEAAQITGADPFSFVLAVTFAASGAPLTPIGYQTNLTVYGPGGYRFTDFLRMGAPLQVLLAIATCVGIWGIWRV
jgi:di/tricarboxylate transporter